MNIHFYTEMKKKMENSRSSFLAFDKSDSYFKCYIGNFELWPKINIKRKKEDLSIIFKLY